MAHIEDSGSYAVGSAIFYYMLGPNSWKEKNGGWILFDSAPPTEILIVQAQFYPLFPTSAFWFLTKIWPWWGVLYACPTYDTKWHSFTGVADDGA